MIDRAITPRFRDGDFAGGLSAGLDQLMALISGEKLPVPQGASPSNPASSGFQWLDLAFVLFFAIPFTVRLLGALIGRKAGSLITGGLVGVLAWLLTTSLVVSVLAMLAAAVIALAISLAPVGRRTGSGFSHGGLGGFKGSGGFGTGGFSSGGGGDFGGGGASGRW